MHLHLIRIMGMALFLVPYQLYSMHAAIQSLIEDFLPPSKAEKKHGAKGCCIHCSAAQGDIDAVKIFLQTDDQLVHRADAHKRTPLWCAAYYKQIDMIRLLRSRGAQICLNDHKDLSALLKTLDYREVLTALRETANNETKQAAKAQGSMQVGVSASQPIAIGVRPSSANSGLNIARHDSTKARQTLHASLDVSREQASSSEHRLPSSSAGSILSPQLTSAGKLIAFGRANINPVIEEQKTEFDKSALIRQEPKMEEYNRLIAYFDSINLMTGYKMSRFLEILKDKQSYVFVSEENRDREFKQAFESALLLGSQTWLALIKEDGRTEHLKRVCALLSLLICQEKRLMDLRDGLGGLPLHRAVFQGTLEIVEHLLNEGCIKAINNQDEALRTPLFKAVSGGKIAIAKLLLAKGAKSESLVRFFAQVGPEKAKAIKTKLGIAD